MRRPARYVLMVTLAAPSLAGCGSSGTTQSAGHASGTPRGTTTSGAPVTTHAAPKLIPPPSPPSRSVRVAVLTYHRVVAPPAFGLPDLKVDPATFAAELAALHGAGYHTIHQAQLFDALYRGVPLPPKPIIISVDDGYVDDLRTILPDLERWHMVATFFVITARMGTPGFLNGDQIRALDQAGMDVGDHTAHHVDLRLLSPSELNNETAGSRQVLDTVLGHPVYYFAYPFGAFNGAVLRAVRSAGFTMAYTTQSGTTESTSAPLTMPRVHIGASETPGGLLSLLGGA